jgi:hypothetical protein
MSLTTVEIAKARDVAGKILDELLLDAYLFELEPRDDVWELTVECACDIDGGWESVTLQIPRKMLLDSFENETAKERLFEYWKKMLADCKTRKA